MVKDNLIVTDDEFGNLVIAEVGQEGQAGEGLKTGDNILTGSASFDANSLYSTYAVLGQHKGSDLEFGRQASQDKSIVKEDFVTTNRFLVVEDIGQSSIKSASAEAAFERNFRLEKYGAAEYEVQGWRQSSKRLWRANQTVSLQDLILQIQGRDRLISKVVYSLDTSGSKSLLVILPKTGYERKGVKPYQGVTKGKTSSPDSWEGVKWQVRGLS